MKRLNVSKLMKVDGGAHCEFVTTREGYSIAYQMKILDTLVAIKEGIKDQDAPKEWELGAGNGVDKGCTIR